MGVLDKFLDVMNISDDDEYEEEYFDEEEYIDEKPKKASLFRRKEDAVDEDVADETLPAAPAESKSSMRQARANKVTPMRQTRRSSTASGMEVRVLKPTSVDDSREIADTLLSNRTVLLNLEGIDIDIAQRIIDFVSGTCFAIEGNLQKVANYIFLVTPNHVGISGDLTDILGGSFDVPSFGDRY